MNIALEKCQEYVNGQLRRSYGDAFVRGNNGQWSTPFPKTGEVFDVRPKIIGGANDLTVLYISSE